MQLNIEQKKIIQSRVMGHCLIRGVAGSGKTTVAVNRIPFLIENYCYSSNDKILMVTFNRSLISYIRHIYSEIEQPQYGEIRIVNIDSLIYEYFLKYKDLKHLDLKLLGDRQKRIDILRECIAKTKKEYMDVKILDMSYANFLMEEIQWIKACGYTELCQYQTVDRVGRTNSSDGPQKLQKNSKARHAIYNLMILYIKTMLSNHNCDFEDMALYALKYVNNYDSKNYTHIIVDESQDLSKVQLEFISRLYNTDKDYSSITFVADTAQSIYTNSWLVKNRSFASIGFDMTGKSTSLSKNYRTTTQIAEAAFSLIEKDENIVSDKNYVKPSLIDRQGNYPVLKSFDSFENELNYVANLIADISKIYSYKNIAIVARTKSLLKSAECILSYNSINCCMYNENDTIDFDNDSVKLITMHSIKGLEFKVVILIGLSNKIIPNINASKWSDDIQIIKSMERKLLYVGMTRANEKLYMSYHGKPSELISDIDPQFLKLNEYSELRNFYNIRFENYIFSQKLNDMYCEEEKVRQWFLNELLTVYRYPFELLDIEYRVTFGSKFGFVDAVVFIYKNSVKIPYIFIEFKKIGTDINDALEQLKTYMAVKEKCQYGAVTNGNDFIVIDRYDNYLNDIPSFDLSMLPSSVEQYKYIDLKYKQEYSILRDSCNIKEITVKTGDLDEVYDETKLTRLNVFDEIAAGKPISINEYISEEFYIPKNWIKYSDDCFILKVKGNSMIEANIDSGDYVIIKYQNTAENRNIVAVEIDGNATLKRYIPTGSVITLAPENENYEGIMLSPNEFRIIGIAVGIIKKQK